MDAPVETARTTETPVPGAGAILTITKRRQPLHNPGAAFRRSPRSITGNATVARGLRTFVGSATIAVCAGYRLHHNPWSWLEEGIERLTDRQLIVGQSIDSGDPQRRSLAGSPRAQDAHVGGVGQTSKPTELNRRRGNGCDPLCKIGSWRIGLSKFVWVWHDFHALLINTAASDPARRICSQGCAR